MISLALSTLDDCEPELQLHSISMLLHTLISTFVCVHTFLFSPPRSFNQVTAMTRCYKRPLLLIEVEEGRPFSLQVCLDD